MPAANLVIKLDIFSWGAIGPNGIMTWVELASQTGLVEWVIVAALLGPALLGGTLGLIGAFRRVRWMFALGGILTLLEPAVSYLAIDWIIKQGLWGSTTSIAIDPGLGSFVALISGTISIVNATFQHKRR